MRSKRWRVTETIGMARLLPSGWLPPRTSPVVWVVVPSRMWKLSGTSSSLFISRFTIPDLKPLAALTKLTRLNLVLCTGDLKNGATLKALPLLENLALLHTTFTNLSFVGNLKNLKVLKIPGTKITNINFVKKLKKLVILDISKTQVTDLTPLKGHQSLVQVLFKGTPVKNLDPLKTLKKLRSISLDTKLKGAKTKTLREANKALKFY